MISEPDWHTNPWDHFNEDGTAVTNENKPPVSRRLSDEEMRHIELDESNPTELDLVYEDLRKAQARIAELEAKCTEAHENGVNAGFAAATYVANAYPNAAAYSVGYDRGYDNAVERCAQVLEDMAEGQTAINVRRAAAAIRTLKDKSDARG